MDKTQQQVLETFKQGVETKLDERNDPYYPEKETLYEAAKDLENIFVLNDRDITKIDPKLVNIAEKIHCMSEEEYQDAYNLVTKVKEVLYPQKKQKPEFFD